MNRRNFFKLLGIVPLAPSVLATLPVAEVAVPLKLWSYQAVIWREMAPLMAQDAVDHQWYSRSPDGCSWVPCEGPGPEGNIIIGPEWRPE